MTEREEKPMANSVVYTVGTKRTTSFAEALVLEQKTGLRRTISYEPIIPTSTAQTDDLYKKRMEKRYGKAVK